jgi:hypothetical protein
MGAMTEEEHATTLLALTELVKYGTTRAIYLAAVLFKDAR